MIVAVGKALMRAGHVLMLQVKLITEVMKVVRAGAGGAGGGVIGPPRCPGVKSRH